MQLKLLVGTTYSFESEFRSDADSDLDLQHHDSYSNDYGIIKNWEKAAEPWQLTIRASTRARPSLFLIHQKPKEKTKEFPLFIHTLVSNTYDQTLKCSNIIIEANGM